MNFFCTSFKTTGLSGVDEAVYSISGFFIDCAIVTSEWGKFCVSAEVSLWCRYITRYSTSMFLYYLLLFVFKRKLSCI